MDVKACLPQAARRVGEWKKKGFTVSRVSDLLDLAYDPDTTTTNPDVIETQDSSDLVTHLRVQYNGFCESGEEIYASDSKYARLFRVHEQDVVVSHINAIHGAIGVVPKALDGHVVTTEYTVCRAKAGIDPRLVWALVRSPEARADLLLLSTGIGRSRVRWSNLASLLVPIPPDSLAKKVVTQVRDAEKIEAQAASLRLQATDRLESEMGLDSANARTILAAFKPPR
jgi:type I restriction enzyme M protein